MVLVVGSCTILDTSSTCSYNSNYYRNSNYSNMCEECKVGEILKVNKNEKTLGAFIKMMESAHDEDITDYEN